MPLTRHARRWVNITLLSRFLNTGSCRTWLPGGTGGPALLQAAGGPAAAWTRHCLPAAHRRTPAPAPGGAGGSERRPPRPGAAPGAPPSPGPGAAGLAAARGPGEGAAAAGGGAAAARRMSGRAGFFEVGAGGAGGGGRTGRARAGPRSIAPPADGSARDPGRLLSLPPPSALGSRSHPLPGLPRQVTGEGKAEGGGTPLAGVSSERRGKWRPPPAPSFASPGTFPSPLLFPASSGVLGRGPGERGAVPGHQAGCRRSAEAPDRWLWAFRGPPPEGRAVVRLPGCVWQRIPAVRERARARNVLGTFCPQLLGRPCRQPLCTPPRAVPLSRANPGRQRPRGGSARRQGAGEGGSWCSGREDGARHSSRPGSRPAAPGAVQRGGATASGGPRPPPRAGSTGPCLARGVPVLRGK